MIQVYRRINIEPYSPENKNSWELINAPLEEAIKFNAGDNTIMLQWEEDGCYNQFVIRSYVDTYTYSNRVADEILKRIKEQFSK